MSVLFRLEAPYRGEYVLHRLTFGSGEPRVAMVAGVHGNEVAGTYALNLVAGILRMRAPKGTVHLLPCVNTVGADEGRKRWPFDDRDLNRAFPGSADGLAVDRIAHAVMEGTDAEVCLDVHSGSSVIHELPHTRAPLSGRELAIARAAALPVTWRRARTRYEDGLVGAWRDAGRAALQIRGGRAGQLDVDDARTMARGLLRVLVDLGMIPTADPSAGSLETDRVTDFRASCGGFFVAEAKVGDRVQAGAVLGVLRHPLGGEALDEVRAERPGTVIAARVYPMVHAQELLLRLADHPVR